MEFVWALASGCISSLLEPVRFVCGGDVRDDSHRVTHTLLRAWCGAEFYEFECLTRTTQDPSGNLSGLLLPRFCGMNFGDAFPTPPPPDFSRRG